MGPACVSCFLLPPLPSLSPLPPLTWSSFMRIISVSRVMPALLTSTSIRPHCFTVSSTRRWMSAASLRLAPTTMASPPDALMAAATSSAAPAEAA